jgi:hypothetical protein
MTSKPFVPACGLTTREKKRRGSTPASSRTLYRGRAGSRLRLAANRVMAAMLQMKKFDIAALERAHSGR